MDCDIVAKDTESGRAGERESDRAGDWRTEVQRDSEYVMSLLRSVSHSPALSLAFPLSHSPPALPFAIPCDKIVCLKNYLKIESSYKMLLLR